MNDFDRNAWCLLGMPIDVVTYEEALDRISSSAEEEQRCFFSTPNLNFITTALKDRAFLNSVICSDLVLLDGMPPVWVSKILGIPAVKKISGSDLFETLWQSEPRGSRKIRVFLFGGEEGVAARACERINLLARGMECVGYYFPGFDSVETMSSGSILEKINQTDADFVVVALGAAKGQAWIMSNQAQLRAPVVSHLGAVVNFAADSIARAPVWMQKAGMEWLWRISQEPSLWKRYFFDGIRLLELILVKVIPYTFWRGLHFRQLKQTAPVDYTINEEAQQTTILLKGDCLQGTIPPLRILFDRVSRKSLPIKLDLAGVGLVDGAFLGLCLLLYKQAIWRDFSLSFVNVSRTHQRVFKWNAVDWLL